MMPGHLRNGWQSLARNIVSLASNSLPGDHPVTPSRLEIEMSRSAPGETHPPHDPRMTMAPRARLLSTPRRGRLRRATTRRTCCALRSPPGDNTCLLRGCRACARNGCPRQSVSSGAARAMRKSSCPVLVGLHRVSKVERRETRPKTHRKVRSIWPS